MCTPACVCVHVFVCVRACVCVRVQVCELDFALISDIGRYFTFCNLNVIYQCVWTHECVCVY